MERALKGMTGILLLMNDRRYRKRQKKKKRSRYDEFIKKDSGTHNYGVSVAD